MKNIKFIIPVLVLLLLMITPFSSFGQEEKIVCSECHDCEKPTSEDNCLKTCPSLHRPEANAAHKVNEAPDTFLIDEISELYQPVKFSHKLHADMAQMGLECETCHHYSPKGHIPPCSDCHGKDKEEENLRMPSLKGAYHRQCLSCHREWSHETKCILCHLPQKNDGIFSMEIDSTDIIGIPHPVINVPEKETYRTKYSEGPVVTFYHQEHIDLFGLKCVDCHRQENCSFCHDLAQENRQKKDPDEVHNICSGCHTIFQDKPETCKFCHDKKTRPGFSHAKNWRLSKYHVGLECRNCHPTGKQITTMNADCNNCHAGWNFENFKHSVTGLEIDELHSELDCSDCHTGANYHVKPSCDNCHDDGRTFEDAPPGEFVN